MCLTRGHLRGFLIGVGLVVTGCQEVVTTKPLFDEGTSTPDSRLIGAWTGEDASSPAWFEVRRKPNSPNVLEFKAHTTSKMRRVHDRTDPNDDPTGFTAMFGDAPTDWADYVADGDVLDFYTGRIGEEWIAVFPNKNVEGGIESFGVCKYEFGPNGQENLKFRGLVKEEVEKAINARELRGMPGSAETPAVLQDSPENIRRWIQRRSPACWTGDIKCQTIMRAQLVDNTAYVAWSRFKPGVKVQYTISRREDNTNSSVTGTLILDSLTPDTATVAESNEKTLILAKVPKAYFDKYEAADVFGMHIEIPRDILEARRVTQGEFLLQGRKVPCELILFKTNEVAGYSEEGSIAKSPEVPGGVVKYVSSRTRVNEEIAKEWDELAAGFGVSQSKNSLTVYEVTDVNLHDPAETSNNRSTGRLPEAARPAPSAATLPVLPGGADQGEKEVIDNPLYRSWARFKPGTLVAYTITPKAADREAKVEKFACTLLAVNTERVVLILKGPDGSTAETTIPAKGTSTQIFGSNVSPSVVSQIALLGRGALIMGHDTRSLQGAQQEKVVAGRREFVCGVFESRETSTTGEVSNSVTVWASPEVPGGTVRVRIGARAEAGDGGIEMVLSEFDPQ
jgi:hypothetical protein